MSEEEYKVTQMESVRSGDLNRLLPIDLDAWLRIGVQIVQTRAEFHRWDDEQARQAQLQPKQTNKGNCVCEKQEIA